MKIKTAPLTIHAADLAPKHVRGPHKVLVHPRGTTQQALLLDAGSRVTVSGAGGNIYLTLPPSFQSPGPRYGVFSSAEFRYRINGGAWKRVSMAEIPNQIPLGENLGEGLQRIEVQGLQQVVALKDFVFSADPLTGIRGAVTTGSYSELLTDVRLDTFSRGRLQRSDYVRNPASGKFALLGLKPGTYRFRFTASGWLAYETRPVKIPAGEQLDLGAILLEPAQALRTYAGRVAASFTYGLGKAICVTPGGSFAMRLVPGVEQAQLLSPYKCINLKIATPRVAMPEPGGEWPFTTFSVPDDTPHDMYTLRLRYGSASGCDADDCGYIATHGRRHFRLESPLELQQAVCVRDALPQKFYMAGISHTNTWGQQNSEYLARVAEIVQLAGARNFMIANEVNAAYIAGALSDLRIPYLVTPGNHTMARWDHFFGLHPFAADDGPLRIVTFHDLPNRSWEEAARLADARAGATNRVLLAWEAFAPLDTIRRRKIGLLFAGHSYEEHPAQNEFPAGAMRVRAPGSETLRWIPMTHEGVDATCRTPREIPLLEVPRDGLSPLRAEYSAPNDGTAQTIRARIINEYDQPFPQARLRLLLQARPSGEYLVRGGKCLQSFLSDDKTKCILDIETTVSPRSEAHIEAIPAQGAQAPAR